jgi:hypothetical protein
MAQANRLTPELRVDLERQLADGVPFAVVAQRFGIGRRTLTRWIADGRVVRRRLDPAPEPASIGLSAFEEQFDRAEAGPVGVVVDAARSGSWQASAWLLERRWPERWARPPQRQAQPDGLLAGQDDPFAEVDLLAERRRRRRDLAPTIPSA